MAYLDEIRKMLAHDYAGQRSSIDGYKKLILDIAEELDATAKRVADGHSVYCDECPTDPKFEEGFNDGCYENSIDTFDLIVTMLRYPD